MLSGKRRKEWERGKRERKVKRDKDRKRDERDRKVRDGKSLGRSFIDRGDDFWLPATQASTEVR